jgi:GWxTD domain-containing protein
MNLRTPALIGAAGLIILSLAGCGASGTSLGKSNQRPYDFEAHILHPRCAVLPAGIDSVDVYLEWSREEALFLRDSPQSPFTANLQLKAGTFDIAWSDTLVDFAPPWDRKQWRVSLAAFASEWNQSTNLIPMQLDDLHRNASATWQIPLPQPGIPRTPFQSDGWPVHDGFAAAGDTLYFESAPGSRWQHASIAVPEVMPAPPFSQVKDKSDTLQPAIRSDWNTDETGWSGYIVQPGVNVVGQPTASGTLRVAHRIVGTSEDHPLVRDLQLMIQSSRYITSRKEFERMVSASDPKAALDAFWLSCGNEKEASAALIATYYGRVEEANRYFSGVHPGWRTDRGMVHIVFGIPNKVRRGSDSEWWIYGEEGSANALVFRFLHVEHPWDNAFYVLSRSIQFRSPWDRMVTNWRNGRIKAD